MDNLTILLNILLGTGFAATLTAIVAAVRKWKSGEIVDDDAIIARLDRDNLSLRNQLQDLREQLEVERQARWKAEDIAAECRRQLKVYETEHGHG